MEMACVRMAGANVMMDIQELIAALVLVPMIAPTEVCVLMVTVIAVPDFTEKTVPWPLAPINAPDMVYVITT